MSHQELIENFISRWQDSGAAERANYQMFLAELCEVLGVPRPDPTSPDPEKNLYVFDRSIVRTQPDGSAVTNYIDFYKASHFVCETKQGSSEILATEDAIKPTVTKAGHGKRGTAAFDKALERAYNQARDYITSLPASHGRPPFLIVCDVGHSLDLYTEFTCTGGRYERFPDPLSYRIYLTDLRREEIRERLRLVFTDPHSLDPAKKAAEVTRDIADRLAKLAKSLESAGHDAHVIAGFLQRCLFTMFAEDIGLLPENGFKDLLHKVKDAPQGFGPLVSGLWKEMATGTQYSALLFQEIAHFNGGLFENTSVLPLTSGQLAMLIDAAGTDWSGVEPSIFGTLLTRALDSRERHKLGAEYTPRSYVERLIRPTIIEPLRQQWDAVRLSAALLHREAENAEDRADECESAAKHLLASGNSTAAKTQGTSSQKLRTEAKKKDAEALKLVTTFHRHLCAIKVLDPACGTANFLYVTLEHMKRLEAEVLELVTALGGDATFEMNEYKVRPEQFLGLELSPNAVAIAQLVLWIGYFQWQRKTTGKADTGDRPLLPKTQSIRQQDAVLAYDERTPRLDPASGKILTVWNGYTTKTHPVTGKEVPDESATIALFDYSNPRRAEWPQADYIVGNPPFIGASRMRDALGAGYTEALRKVWKGEVPESADFVMYWWAKAAAETAQKRCQSFGFITTNSIHQTFNRRVIESFLSDAKKPLHLAYAIPDHPWIDSADGAAVRIAMTVAAPGKAEGILEKVTDENPMEHDECEVSLNRNGGLISPNLQIGADLTSIFELRSNSEICWEGMKPHGKGFLVNSDEARQLGFWSDGQPLPPLCRYFNGRDLMDISRDIYAIDLYGYSLDEVASKFPSLLNHLMTTVKPERDQNNRDTYRVNWWFFGEPRRKNRPSLVGISRFFVTVKTAKHRTFAFLDNNCLPDSKLISIASDDAYLLGVLSSSVHCTWTLKVGSHLGVGNDPTYVVGSSFNKFPFPALEETELKQHIRELGERLDAHRKRQQELHPTLTLTGMYNVLEKLRSEEALNAKEKLIHDQGLVTILQQLHKELDAAVLEAYGWSDITAAREMLPAVYDFKTGSIMQVDMDLDQFDAHIKECEEAIEQELLTRLVALNHQRAAEEKRGLIRYLRPDYQNPQATKAAPIQSTFAVTDSPSSLSTTNIQNPTAQDWPAKLPEQVALIRQLLSSNPTATAEQLSTHFGRKNKSRTDQIEGIIETLKSLGQW